MMALHDAIAALNGGARYQHVTGDITVSEPLPDLTERGTLDLRGAFITSTIPASGPPLISIDGGSITVYGGWIETVEPQDLFHFKGGGDCQVKDQIITGVGTVARFGNGSSRASRCTVSGLHGSYRGSGAMFAAENASGTRINVNTINGGGDNSALVSVWPSTGGFVDTLHMAGNVLQSYRQDINGNPIPSSGADYGLLVDTRAGKVVNLWGTDCVFDHTKTAGIMLRAPYANSGIVRNLRMTNVRNDADLGFNVLAIANSSAPWSDNQINFSHFHSPNSNYLSLDPNAKVTVRFDHHITT